MPPSHRQLDLKYSTVAGLTVLIIVGPTKIPCNNGDACACRPISCHTSPYLPHGGRMSLALFNEVWSNTTWNSLEMIMPGIRKRAGLGRLLVSPQKLVLLVLVIALLGTSCARRNSVVIKQGDPQQFIISSKGLLDVFTVSGPTRSGRMDNYWVIAPLDPNFE